MPNLNFSKYKVGQVIGYNGAAYVISHADRRYLTAINLTTEKIKVHISRGEHSAPAILAETVADYVKGIIDRQM